MVGFQPDEMFSFAIPSKGRELLLLNIESNRTLRGSYFSDYPIEFIIKGS